MLPVISDFIHNFENNQTFVIFPNMTKCLKPRDDQMCKSVCTSCFIRGKFSLKSKLLSKLLVGILTPRYLTKF